MRRFVRQHPLAFVLIVAIFLRLPAVIFSKGYMASDDQFETVEIAHRWTYGQVWYEDGIRMWPHRPAAEHARPVVYPLILYSVMELNEAVGIATLDGMMYSIRALHAALSLLAVWAAFQIVLISTRSRNWAIAAGLGVAGHFLLPFLSVRTLIEMVSGNLWIVALLFLYRYREKSDSTWLVWAGVMTGLAWVFRFEIAFAAIAVPGILWWRNRSIRPAVVYSSAVAGMLLLSGIFDWVFVDGFAASTISHVRQVLTETPPYQTDPAIYVLVLLGVFIPPLSLLLFSSLATRDFLREHALLWVTSLVFVVAHTLSPSRQERYMIPILSVLIVMFVLALWHQWHCRGWLFRRAALARGLLIAWIGINLILLVPMTINYGHRGLVETMTQLSELDDRPAVVIVSPEKGHIYPFAYAGGIDRVPHWYVHRWGDFGILDSMNVYPDSAEYFVLYPSKEARRAEYLDSLQRRVGPLVEVTHVGPSAVDRIAHLLNPRRNPTNEAWIYRRIGLTDSR